MAETISAKLLAQAQEIRSQAIAEFKANPPGGSPLRDVANLFTLVKEKFIKAILPESLHPVNFTLGSVAPETFGHLPNGEIDPMEAEFADLAGAMAINPYSEPFVDLFKAIQQIVRDEWDDPTKIPLTGYDGQAKGRPETRQLYLDNLEELGFHDLKLENAFLCTGGMDGMIRTIRSLVDMSYAKFYQEHESLQAFAAQLINSQKGFMGFLMKIAGPERVLAMTEMLSRNINLKPLVEAGFPIPGFTMVANAAMAEGANIVQLPTQAEKRFEFPAEEIESVLETHPFMDILILTPFQNPTTHIMDPDNLKNLMINAVKTKPDIKFVFDMAYLELVEPETAKQMVKAMYDSGAINNCVIIDSRSKADGQPRLRGGLIYAFSDETKKALEADTMRGFPSFSWVTDVYLQALETYFDSHPEVLPRYRELLNLRQDTLFNVLKKIDEKDPGKIFTSIKVIERHGVPLYLMPTLAPGITAMDLAEKFGIFGASGEIFGGEKNQVRFALSTNSCSTIANLANIIN